MRSARSVALEFKFAAIFVADAVKMLLMLLFLLLMQTEGYRYYC